MKRNHVFILALLSFSFLVYLDSYAPTKKEQVKIVTPPSIIASLPHWVAMKQGYYKDANIDPLEYNFTDSKVMVSALLTNDAEVLPAVSLVDVVSGIQSSAGLSPIIYSHSRMKSSPPFEALLVPTGSKISTLLDLENKTIAVYPGATAKAVVESFLKKNKVNTRNITFKSLPPPQHLDLLLSGEIDCSHSYDPFRTANMENGKTRALTNSLYASYNEPSGIGISVISQKFYKERNSVAKKFLAVWDRSIMFIRDNPTEARKILMEKLKLTENVAKQATWVDATTTTEFDQTTVNKTIESMKEIGIIPNSFHLTDDYFLNFYQNK